MRLTKQHPTRHTSGGRKASLGRRHIFPYYVRENVLYAQTLFAIWTPKDKRAPHKNKRNLGLFENHIKGIIYTMLTLLNNLIKPIILLTITILFTVHSEELNMQKVLIVIGSEKGSTLEIGNKMKTILEKKECKVDCISAPPHIIALHDYDFIVIGSGIYGGVPHKNIKAFIDSNRTELTQKNIAVFAVCGMQASKSQKHRDQALHFTDSVSYGLKPSIKTVFAGKIPSYSIANFILRLAIGAWPGDHRDWKIIENWTDSLSVIINGKL
jgi:menaquinone-dependent protoporphyrinogen IX oxidase